MITKKRIAEYLPHIIGMLFLGLLPMFIFDASEDRIKVWTYRYYYQSIFLVIAFYANYLIFFPKFFITKKKVKYLLSLILLSIGLLSTSQYVAHKFDLFKAPDISKNELAPERKKNVIGLHPRLMDDAFLLLLVLGFSTGMAVLQQARKKEDEKKELDKTNIETELAFLKNQINPHFFFNSLNNIYALVALDSDKAQKAIEELSGLMRYLIYESNVELISIEKEFDFSRNYIALMQKRLSSKVKLIVDIQENLPKIEVPPLLFVSFIENTFKHGISYREKSFINIKLHADEQNISFTCINSIPEQNNHQSDRNSGVGITNIKKRLELIYGEDFMLDISEKKNEFVVKLEISPRRTHE
jgi:LytS/YehU family sensor histidine kinase